MLYLLGRSPYGADQIFLFRLGLSTNRERVEQTE